MKTGNNYSALLDSFIQKYEALAETHANIVTKSQELRSLVKDADEAEQVLAGTDCPITRSSLKVESADRNRIKEQIFKFVSTESNRDNHICEVILRKTADKYRIKLTHYSGSFDYAAFQSIWHFANNEEEAAHKVFATLARVLNDIKQEHNSSQKHSVALVPNIREAVKTIAESHRHKKNILSLDENDLQRGESDWQQTIYGSKYPAYQEESKQEMFSGGHNETVKRTMHTGRSSSNKYVEI